MARIFHPPRPAVRPVVRPLGGVALAVVAAIVMSPSARADIVAEPLPPFVELAVAEANAINDAGVAVGDGQAKANTPAALWDGSGIHALEPLPGDTLARAVSINTTGVSVGLSESGANPSHPVKWNPDLTITALPGLDRSANPAVGYANGINDNGAIAGTLGHDDHAVRWDPDGFVQILSPAPIPDYSKMIANSINIGGTVVGVQYKCRSYPSDCEFEAVRWAPEGTGKGLGTLPDDLGSVATGINDAGITVGYSYRKNPDGSVSSFTSVRWDADGTITALPAPPAVEADRSTPLRSPTIRAGRAEISLAPGGKISPAPNARLDIANAINSSGAAVGRSFHPDSALEWNPDGTPTLLPKLPGQGFEARGMNDTGMIVGVCVREGPIDLLTAIRWRDTTPTTRRR